MKHGQKNNQTVQEQQQQVLDKTETCLKAASIDQSSLFNALSDLAQHLHLYIENISDNSGSTSNKNHENSVSYNSGDDGSDNGDTNTIKEGAEVIDGTTGTMEGGNVHSDIDADIDAHSLLRHVTSSILQLDLVRTGSATLSNMQQNIQHKIDECLDLCGVRLSFMVALDKIMNHTSNDMNHNIIKNDVMNTAKCCDDTSIILSSSRLIRRLLTQSNKNSNAIGHCTLISPGKDLQSFLNEFFFSSNYNNHPNEQKQHSDSISIVNISQQLKRFSSNTTIPSQMTKQQQFQQFKKQLEIKILHFINTTLILLPTQIANAYHSCNLKLPIWATRSNLFIKFIESAAYAAFSSFFQSFVTVETNNDGNHTNNHHDEIDCDLTQNCESGRSTQGRKKIQNKITNDKIEMIYFTKLMEVLLRHGSSDEVSCGIYNFWKQQCDIESMSNDNVGENGGSDIGYDINNDSDMVHITKVLLQSQLIQLRLISSPRSCAILIRSCIKKIISEIELYPSNMNRSMAKRISEKDCMPFLYDIGIVGILSSSLDTDDAEDEDNNDGVENDNHCEMFVSLMILSPSPTGDLNEQKLITRCVVELLAGCNRNSIISCSNQEEAATNKGYDGKGCPSVLMGYLLKVVNVWNDAMFINETDTLQQRHVSSFILDAMDYMHIETFKRNINQENIIQALVTGITNRLEVSEGFIRQDGMMVAEKLAPLLGEDLKFDELDDIRHDEDINTPLSKNDHRNDKDETLNNVDVEVDRKQKRATRKKERKKRISVEIDPDEEYLSDDGSSVGIESVFSDSSDNYNSDSADDDSEWGEEDLVPFNLSDDDEEDLRPVPKPNYLQECLTLLRCSEDDNEARCKHEVALTEVSSLVRDCPPDLLDIGEALTKELLYIENRYNISSFLQLRWDGLCALAVCAPTNTIPFLQAQLFADIPLELRMDVLEVMKYSSSELCGQVELDKRRIERYGFIFSFRKCYLFVDLFDKNTPSHNGTIHILFIFDQESYINKTLSIHKLGKDDERHEDTPMGTWPPKLQKRECVK